MAVATFAVDGEYRALLIGDDVRLSGSVKAVHVARRGCEDSDGIRKTGSARPAYSRPYRTSEASHSFEERGLEQGHRGAHSSQNDFVHATDESAPTRLATSSRDDLPLERFP